LVRQPPAQTDARRTPLAHVSDLIYEEAVQDDVTSLRIIAS